MARENRISSFVEASSHTRVASALNFLASSAEIRGEPKIKSYWHGVHVITMALLLLLPFHTFDVHTLLGYFGIEHSKIFGIFRIVFHAIVVA